MLLDRFPESVHEARELMDACQAAQRMVVLVLWQGRIVHQFVLQIPIGEVSEQVWIRW